MKIKDVETRPAEVNVHSASVSEEEKIFFTEEGDETEEQIWERSRLYEKGHKVDETERQIDVKSKNNMDEITNFTQRLRRTIQILLEQARDPITLQRIARIQKEEFSRGNSPRGHSVQTLFEQSRPHSPKGRNNNKAIL